MTACPAFAELFLKAVDESGKKWQKDCIYIR